MTIKYTPTEQNTRIEPGNHFVRVKNATEGWSSKGDQTIELELTVGRDGGATMRDTLYNSERAAWRITQARKCFGFADEIGEEIEFAAADMIGCTGYVEVGLGEPRTSGKHVGKSFMEIKKYLPRDFNKPTEAAVVVEDDIPF